MSEATRSRTQKVQYEFRYYVVDQYGSPVAGAYDLPGVREAVLRLNVDVDVKFQLELTMEETSLLDPLHDWVKVLALETVGATTTEYSLGLYRLSMPREQLGSKATIWRLRGYDRTIQLVHDKFTELYTVAAGSNPVEAVKAICVGVGIPESMINFPETDNLLQAPLSWEQGTAKLRAVTELLNSFGARSPWSDANGYLRSRVPPALEQETPAQTYGTGEAGIVIAPADRQKDDTGIANRVVVRVQSPSTIYSIIVTLADSSHPLHPDNLGYTRTKMYDLTNVTDVATAQEYAIRRLEEGLSFFTRGAIRTLLDFGRAGNAFEVYELDLRDKNDKVLMDGKWRVKGWTMELRTDGRMLHELRRVEAIGGEVDVSLIYTRMDIAVFEPIRVQDEIGVVTS